MLIVCFVMFKLGGRNITLFFVINRIVYTFTIINFKTKQMVNTNFSNQTTNQLLSEYQFRVEALQNKIEELKAILQVNNLI